MLQIGSLQKTLRNGAYKKVRIVLKGDMHKEMFSDAISIKAREQRGVGRVES